MSVRRSRIALLAIVALFVVPLAVAWLMYRGTLGLVPQDTVNEGRLVEPPQPLDWADARHDAPTAAPADLAGAWVSLYPLPDPCETACLERIRMLRQVQRALGKDADRMRVAVLAPGRIQPDLAGRLRKIHPQIHLLERPAGRMMTAVRRAGEGTAAPSVYLVDPLGNVMMTYESADSMNKLRKDLEKLLKWSKLDQAADQRPGPVGEGGP